jgi:predicted dithiol-disulfide oxidoreductase (DUF899 family)
MPLTLAIISVLAVLAIAATWAMWPWLDRAPLGRNEGDMS